MKLIAVTSTLCVALLLFTGGSESTGSGAERIVKRVKRAEPSSGSSPCYSPSGRASQPRGFIDQNSPPLPAYPPKGNGPVILARRLRSGVPIPPQVIRLRSSVPDTNPNEGRIEIRKDKKWGLVCDGYWDTVAANVACKELGFKGGSRLTKRKSAYGIAFGTKNRDVTVGEVRCTGKEKSIMDCGHKKPKCKKRATAGVVCFYNDGCPYGWTSFNGVCYRVEYEEKSFRDAEAYCATKKAKLIYFIDDKESNFISDMLKLRFPNVTAAWTGGNWMEKRGSDGRRYGAWVWSGTIQTVSSKNNHVWFPGFSGSTKRPQQSYRNRSCIAISSIFLNKENNAIETNYFWWDNISCKQKLPFICQRANFKWRGRSLSTSCYTGDGSSYRGTAFRTEEGSMCDKWTSPFSSQTPENSPGKGLGDHNYCRNPDGDVKPWCWVDAEKGMFGYCNLKQCPKVKPTPAGTKHPPTPGFGLSNCRPDQYFCPSMYRYQYGCIEKKQVCDGRKDCNDNEDELETFCRTYRCTTEQFYCYKNNYCIKKSMKCDGSNDCSDRADEKDCPSEGNPLDLFTPNPDKRLNSLAKLFFYNRTMCAKECTVSARKGPPCLSFNYVPPDTSRPWHTCEILTESVRNEKAPLVTENGATHFEFIPDCGGTKIIRCKNGRCLRKQFKCNNIDDCGDNSDEENCGDSQKNVLPLKVRLAGGRDKWEGRVEVRHNGEWGLICDKGFDQNDGNVICRMLGFKGCLKALRRSYQVYGRGNGNMLLSQLECQGNEANIDQCKHNGWRRHDCRGYQVSGVICAVNRACTNREFRCVQDELCVNLDKVCNGVQDCPDGTDETSCEVKVSLKGGKDNKEGRLSIMRNNIEGTVCKDSFDDKDAKVFCRMLGFEGEARADISGKFGQGTGVIWMDDLSCKGNEKSVTDCAKKWAPADCSHKEDVGIRCNVPPGTPAGTGPGGSSTGAFKCGQRPKMIARQRVVGGFDAQPGQFPWQVGIRRRAVDYSYDAHWCGGTIISHKWVLSACHCYGRPKNEYLVRAGDRDNNEDEGTEQTFEIDLLLLNPRYTGPPEYDYDLTLIKVKPRAGNRYIEFNDYVQPACIPKKSFKLRDFDECFISGWGSVGQNRYPKILQAIGLPLISDSDCRNYHPGAITERMQCAGYRQGGKDSCQGDSGGPLACKRKRDSLWYAWGQTSWGLVCAAPNSPGVYAKVISMLDWVNKTITEHGGL